MNWKDDFKPEVKRIVEEVEKQIQPRLSEIDDQVTFNQRKVLEAFQKERISEENLNGATGYGYNDMGRDALDRVYADVFKTEDALVRPQFVSGTHTISSAYFGMLRPGDKLLYLTGMPYDTIQEVIGVTGKAGMGSLKDFKIDFDYVPLLENGKVDFKAAKTKLTDQVKVVAIQRSRGYSSRSSFTVDEIKVMVDHVREILPNAIIFVDNCYGEFSEMVEPTEVGVDVMVGSLIKNAGGGIAHTGGYVVGKQKLIEMIANRLTNVGAGKEEGATLENLRRMYQGFFMAPEVTGAAIKGAIFESAILEKCNLQVDPKWNDPRTDLIQTINFGEPDSMIRFAKQVQKNSPIDSYVDPEPSQMAGYEDKVIMAAGTFVQGASIEFSADGPIRPPYTLYLQGGLTYSHVKIAITKAVEETFFN
ncbi:aminotransferase class I/II-fold pyridoxal phosphate-dependent enzyme [Pediococcus pentosaceus]|jgi:cystathionine beta-lyase family protein involved in aluminum resistance|uniref:methionine gamma-lyase family protein n=1 Tax=Pediococcus pentosaceus TaxID=1255 RepID=UPI000E0689BA|nr:aminotransferase class V-fold PLP-dependent enzyme [Pediococcus pentosaceus]AXR43323.1 aluminum resistance protein [Pediococcus pentosaceus]KAF0519813.1 aminotransferase class V-fold PLP-dependent enzyme [Pediococcus pentosaceus]MBF7110957.1 aminotransferase class V-fold PLP-dependent enzyme [Pediococcus pentosaceus]MBF7115939.1 aminotransferase class V-fold PLP-dependent enzyme [Pediococcus pentosaceus]MBF7117930.1 aminotransferase class V-fold PLP-dependent enzyme [Pediococcus pentosaceus